MLEWANSDNQSWNVQHLDPQSRNLRTSIFKVAMSHNSILKIEMD